jgi:asparagine synthase (glutamine-hydrolysing)
MCGIAGYVGLRDETLLREMTAALAHRGPDDAGYLIDGEVGLGHRRLSIIDLAGGHQPIFNEDESLAVIANGEIYNYRELSVDLRARGHRFRTGSDCEVILHLYEEMGPRCVERMIGMFTFALWDKRARRLLIGRDRLGVKPLYYAALPGAFLFASEAKALLRYRGLDAMVDPHGIVDYLALRYSPGPGGMFREIKKLPAGCVAEIDARGEAKIARYWEPPLCAGPWRGSERDWLEGFAERFERSIERRLIADVPLGAYLSGGVDSSVIVAAMAKRGGEPVRTFTVGFDFEHDELSQAAFTAKELGCRHTEIESRAEDVALLPEIVWHLDEPIGDAIVVPMYQLAREAKKQVSVILAGEGADETLGGYLFHKALLYGDRLAHTVPEPLRRGLLLPALRALPASAINLAFSYPAALGERGKQRLVDFIQLLGADHLPAAYRHLISLFDERDMPDLLTDDFRARLAASPAPTRGVARDGRDVPFLNRAIDLQFEHWLPDDILTKQDKVSMAHALEVRVPFLDHELVEYALSIPPRLKIRRFVSKWLLRRYAERLLPKSVTSRRKMPFYVPVERYLEQPRFRELVGDALTERALRERGIFRPEAVARLRDSVASGEFLYSKQLLSIVILELWFRAMVDRRGVR